MNAVGIQVRSSLVMPCAWAAVCLAVASASGCKTGTSGVKPAWWSFGGSSATDPALASAPAFEGDVKKPSDSAKPYPTTTTPNGYVLNDAAGSPGAGESPQSQSEIPAAVTYGSTPKPATVAAVPAGAATVPALQEAQSAQPPSAVAAQVGPYAGLTTEPGTPPGFSPATPALSPVPQTAATPPSVAYPAGPGAAFGSTSATDQRDAAAWSPAPAAPSSALSEGRYGSTSGSRFASLPPAAGGLPAVAPSAGQPASGSAASYGGLPTGLDPLPASAASAAAPAAGFSSAPSALPSSAGPAFAPPAAPVGGPPAIGLPPASGTPPSRRPDPGYRPGGTSSYRPSRAILADDTTIDSAVRPAGFEAPLPRGPAGGVERSVTSP